MAERIRLTRTVPDKARQNGIAERMNETLNERTRSMKIHYGLPKILWVNVVNSTIYLINRGAYSTLRVQVARRTMDRKRTVYIRVDPEKSDKLDVESMKCYLIGYDSDIFGYKFWDVKNKRILRLSLVIAGTQGTSETIAEELEVEQVAPEQVLKISLLDYHIGMYLHITLLLTDEGEPKPFDETLQLEDTSKWEKVMNDGMSRLHK